MQGWLHFNSNLNILVWGLHTLMTIHPPPPPPPSPLVPVIWNYQNEVGPVALITRVLGGRGWEIESGEC